MSERPAGPYAGIKVLDLGLVLAAPYTGMILADLGADVVKVEATTGDPTRTYRPPDVGGEAAYFLFVNRNKRSVAIDLKSDEGRAAMLAMAAGADVLIENFRSGVMHRLGLDYDVLKAANPGLIYCAVSGYGRTGPMAERAGYDPIVQAEAGLMAMTGEPDGPPNRIGVSVVDMAAGAAAAQAVSAALYARRDTGRGQFVDANLFATAANMVGNFAAQSLLVGDDPRRIGSGSQAAQPSGVYATADGQFMLTIGNDAMYRRFCDKVIERPDLATDPRFADNSLRLVNRTVLTETLTAIFAERTTAAWLARLDTYGIPAGEINGVRDAMTSPMAEAVGLVREAPHPTLGPLKTMMPPYALSDTPVRDPVAAPLLGQHSREVLRDWAGFDEAHIDAMLTAGTLVVTEI